MILFGHFTLAVLATFCALSLNAATRAHSHTRRIFVRAGATALTILLGLILFFGSLLT